MEKKDYGMLVGGIYDLFHVFWKAHGCPAINCRVVWLRLAITKLL